MCSFDWFRARRSPSAFSSARSADGDKRVKMSAGTAVRESIAAIRAAGATPHAVAIALDRQEKATEDGADVPHSAVQYVRNALGLEVVAIATLDDLLQYLSSRANDELRAHREGVLAYRARYGAS